MTTVLIADDHATVRAGLRLLLEAHGLDVVGEAGDGHQALTVIAATAPDVVLTDARMPGLDGLEATRAVLSAVPSTAVLMLTMLDEDDAVFAAMRVGARGYLLKGAEQRDIDSLFSGAKTTALQQSFEGLDDFELIAFLAIVEPEATDD